MAKAEWTFQVPPAGSDAVGLEEYVVEDAVGTRIGRVMTLLRRDGGLYLAVERGNPPVTRDVRAVEWGDVERVDHDALTVFLKLEEEGVERALELDPGRSVETGDAEAVRVTDAPPDVARAVPTGETAGPVDRPSYALALALGLLGVFAFLVLVIAALAVDFTWHFALFAIPAALVAAAAVVAYRLFRTPYQRR